MFRRLDVERRPRSPSRSPNRGGFDPAGGPGGRRVMADPGTPERGDDPGLRVGRADELRADPELVPDLLGRVGGPELKVPHAGRDDHGDPEQHGAHGKRELETADQCSPR